MHSKSRITVLLALLTPSLGQNFFPECTNTNLSVLDGTAGTPCAVINRVLGTLQFAPNVPSLLPGQGYGLPSDGEFPLASAPMCTIVMYNLVQGCAACQQTTAVAEQLPYPSVNEWGRRCTETSNPINSLDFAPFIANGDIPAWAQTAPSVGNTFNLQALLASLAVSAQPGVTLSFTTPHISTESPSASASSIPPSAVVAESAGLASPPIGAIVGGVVGGVVVLLLIGGLIFWLCRRKRSRNHLAPSAEFMNARHIPLAQDDDDDREMSAPMRHSLVGDAPPAFTPGQFKDPIFEKGVAISTGAMPVSSVGHAAATSYSPVAPSIQQGPLRQLSGDQYSSTHQSLRQSSGDPYQSSADAYQPSAGHQYHQSSVDQYHSSVDHYRSDVHPHSPHSPELTQGYRD